IDITEIPPTTTSEAIIEKVVELVKQKKITEINDIRDETGLQGLKITIDLKRGADPEKLIKKLYKSTPLQDSFSCNFNILIAGSPRVMGVKEIISEWVAYRQECVRRRVYFLLTKAKDRLHLLKGLQKILLDIDKAVKIVRETTEEKEVIPNLMIGFGIDEIQAEYVAEIKLRHLNKEYILKRLADIENLEKDIADMESVLSSRNKILRIIIKELEKVRDKFGQPRKTSIINAEQDLSEQEEIEIDESPVTLFFTKDGYFKKITPLSLRMSGEQKLKEGDQITQTVEATNAHELIFFTNKQQAYKAKVSDFADSKASVLGDYVASKLDFEEGETPVYMVATRDYKGNVLFVFENGRVSKVSLSAYQTKTNRKKLVGAYCDKFILHSVMFKETEGDILLTSTNGRMLLVSSAALQTKTTRDNTGVAVMTQKKGQRIFEVQDYSAGLLPNEHRYRTRNLPAAGSFKPADTAEQLTI
ncbi:MAG: topoisomerase IV, partial [Clostridia bacterium]|nr:topoisomerase IV [Clostridia bacterium]